MASRYWVGGGSSTNWDATGNTNWAATSNGSNDQTVPGTNDDVFFDGVGAGASDSNISANITIKSLDCTGYVNTLTQATSTTLTVSGLLFKLVSGMTYTAADATSRTSFSNSSGTCLVTTAGKSMGTVLWLTSGGTRQLQDNWVGIGDFDLRAGTIDCNNKNVTTRTVYLNVTTTTRVLTMGSGTFTLSGASSLIWQEDSPTNLTVNANTSTIKWNNNGSGSYNFNGGGHAYNNFWATGAGTGKLTFYDNNSFNQFKDDGTGAHSLLFAQATTTTVTTFPVSGTPGNLITISSDAANPTLTHTLSCASGTINCDYMNIQHSIATGGATWNAGSNSVNNQGVSNAGSGWIFQVGGFNIALV